MPEELPCEPSKGGAGFSVNIQAMRFVAASMVMFGHLFALLDRDVSAWAGIIHIHSFAYSGVDIFFVISGIVVTSAAQRSALLSNKNISIKSGMRFLFRRIFRIYPVYLVIFVISYAISPWVPMKPAWMISDSMIKEIMLITRNNDVVTQAWTLSFEVYFYGILSILVMFFSRLFFKGILVWLILTVLASSFFSFEGKGGLYLIANPLVIEFGFGCLIQYLVFIGFRQGIGIALLAGLCFFVEGAYETSHFGLLEPLPRLVTFGIGSALILFWVMSIELSSGIKAPRFSQALGDISYSIYLWHLLVLKALMYVSNSFGGAHGSHPLLFMIFGISIVLMLSFCSYRLIEVPFIRLGNFLTTKIFQRDRRVIGYAIEKA